MTHWAPGLRPPGYAPVLCICSTCTLECCILLSKWSKQFEKIIVRGITMHPWIQRLGYDKKSNAIDGHTCPGLTSDLMHTHRNISAWHYTLNLRYFKDVFIFIDLAQIICIFAWLTKMAREYVIIDHDTHDFSTRGRQDVDLSKIVQGM